MFDANKIQNPRVTNGWVTVAGDYLTDNEISSINTLIDRIEHESTVEIAVVVVPNTNGDIFTAAQDLFDRWKIGKKDKDNGILFIASINEHELRTHTGYGMEGIFNDAIVRTLQDSIVVPEFKKGNYGTGIINYISKLHEIISDPSVIESIKAQSINEKSSSKKSNDLFNITIVFSIIGLIFMIGGFFVIFGSLKKIITSSKKSYNKYSKIKQLEEKGLGEFGSLGSIFVFIFGGIFLVVGVLVTGVLPKTAGITLSMIPIMGVLFSVILTLSGYGRKKNIIRKWRNDPRLCPQCGKPMNKLDEITDDNYLQSIQRIEENIKSIDYDVWLCSGCSNKTIEKFRGNKYGLFTQCPHCNGITGKHIASKVIIHPTYSSTGQREISFNCIGCNKNFTRIEVIPRLERSSSSGSSSSSSSSSGGSSFGGGSSGGGGATSSW
jgi:uncharacterized protein